MKPFNRSAVAFMTVFNDDMILRLVFLFECRNLSQFELLYLRTTDAINDLPKQKSHSQSQFPPENGVNHALVGKVKNHISHSKFKTGQILRTKTSDWNKNEKSFRL